MATPAITAPQQPVGTGGAIVARRSGGRGLGARRIAHLMWVWGQRVLLALALSLLLLLGVLPRLGLYRPVTVLSGSMRPTFSPGDMVIDTPEPVRDVRVGQVISYQVPVGIHQVETHRIVRIISGGAHPVVQTQGDANNHVDPWTAQLDGTTAWRMRTVIPHLGYIVNFLRAPALRTAAVIVVPALLALIVLLEIWGLAGGAADSGSETRPESSATGESWAIDSSICSERRTGWGGWTGPERRVGWRAGWTSPVYDLLPEDHL